MALIAAELYTLEVNTERIKVDMKYGMYTYKNTKGIREKKKISSQIYFFSSSHLCLKYWQCRDYLRRGR